MWTALPVVVKLDSGVAAMKKGCLTAHCIIKGITAASIYPKPKTRNFRTSAVLSTEGGLNKGGSHMQTTDPTSLNNDFVAPSPDLRAGS